MHKGSSGVLVDLKFKASLKHRNSLIVEEDDVWNRLRMVQLLDSPVDWAGREQLVLDDEIITTSLLLLHN